MRNSTGPCYASHARLSQNTPSGFARYRSRRPLPGPKMTPLIEAHIMKELADVCPVGPRLHFENGGHNIQKTHAGGYRWGDSFDARFGLGESWNAARLGT